MVVLRTLKVFVVPRELPFKFKFPEKERLPVCVVELPNVIVKLLDPAEANELVIVRLELSVLMIAPPPLNSKLPVPKELLFPSRMVPAFNVVVPE